MYTQNDVLAGFPFGDGDVPGIALPQQRLTFAPKILPPISAPLMAPVPDASDTSAPDPTDPSSAAAASNALTLPSTVFGLSLPVAVALGAGAFLLLKKRKRSRR